MVGLIVAGSAWFQWAHAANRDLPAQVAWTVLPLIAGYLWETTPKYRRRAWKKANTDTGRQVPKARWIWDPVGSFGITRRTHMWNLPKWETGLETHMTRAECVRQLRREFGPFWSWKVPADVAIRLKRGFRVEEAAARVPEVIANHRREVENRRIVKEAEAAARAGVVEPGTYTVALPDTPAVDLSPVVGVQDAVEPLEEVPALAATPPRRTREPRSPRRHHDRNRHRPLGALPARATGTPQTRQGLTPTRTGPDTHRAPHAKIKTR
ncbi:DUF2637 domain-containing protein [Nocardiopsis metallicus]|uniref:Uncharacterized protein n=1 Tax=Nocardiopsis metallicus TaxID=179819 RepID=A0A840W2F5_9ACTN|nr:DUF2637 domain-containing protein [Nocardiopsis metallicus]MBB5491019.1 hypothetical protein [Nocardiopsis metallicus]